MTGLPPLPYPAPPPPPAAEPAKRTAGGRPLGSRDKVSRPLKEAILLAAAEAGDQLAAAALEKDGIDREGGLTGYLTMVACSDVKAFCGLLGRVLPMTIKGEGEGGAIIVEIVKLAQVDAHPTA